MPFRKNKSGVEVRENDIWCRSFIVKIPLIVVLASAVHILKLIVVLAHAASLLLHEKIVISTIWNLVIDLKAVRSSYEPIL